MITNKTHKLFREANSPETRLERLHEIIELGDELLSSTVALNPNCDKHLLDKLSKLDMKEVHKNLSIRYTTYPKLYSIDVREVTVSDASYILKLRLDDSYSKYISKVSDEVSAQENYIAQYLESNTRSRQSFYFILTNTATGERCGTVRVYNFQDDKFEWGSWILDENKTRYAAMETAMLVYEFAFNTLGFGKSEFEVNRNNEKVVSYHIKSGAKVIGEDDVNYYFRVEKEVGLGFAKTLRERLESKLQFYKDE
jgi:RimJ/RimL family protein N-acetyltransferase